MVKITVIVVAILIFVIGLLLFFVPFPVHAQVATITLDWTAPGDDLDVGTATTYRMRWSSTKPDTTSQTTMDSWWDTANIVVGLPIPLIAGTLQNYAVPGPFTTGGTYYFVIQACDEAVNCSAYSNVAWKFLPDTLPPARIIDLRVR